MGNVEFAVGIVTIDHVPLSTRSIGWPRLSCCQICRGGSQKKALPRTTPLECSDNDSTPRSTGVVAGEDVETEQMPSTILTPMENLIFDAERRRKLYSPMGVQSRPRRHSLSPSFSLSLSIYLSV